jgi:geranylgeranyl pyrophosphate synthase
MVVRILQTSPKESEVYAYFKQARDEIAAELANLAPKISSLKLFNKIDYVLQNKGKQLRSQMVLLSGQAVGADMQRLKKLALALELLHAASLVHDDILDRDVFRRNSLSVQAKWGIKDAVLVGDALASLSLSLACDYGAKVLAELGQTCLQLSDGEYMDVEPSQAELSESAYFEKISKKAGSLFRAACKCGAVAGGGSSTAVRCLADFGENYGVAFQIHDDIMDIAHSETAVPIDIAEFRSTLPIIHLYQHADAKTKNLISSMASGVKVDAATFCQLRTKLNVMGSVNYCQAKMDEYIEAALSNLAPLKRNLYKDYLAFMAQQLRQKQ